MSTRLAYGDPATVIISYRRDAVLRVVVRSTHRESFGYVTAPSEIHHLGGGMDYKHEGISWIRGHFADDSPEVRALQVACALFVRAA